MDRILGHICKEKCFLFGNLRILFLFFAEDVIWLVTSNHDLLGQFTSKKVEGFLQVRGESLLQAEEFNSRSLGAKRNNGSELSPHIEVVSAVCGEEGTQLKGKGFYLLVHLRSNPHLW